jgi:hypothetical protein
MVYAAAHLATAQSGQPHKYGLIAMRLLTTALLLFALLATPALAQITGTTTTSGGLSNSTEAGNGVTSLAATPSSATGTNSPLTSESNSATSNTAGGSSIAQSTSNSVSAATGNAIGSGTSAGTASSTGSSGASPSGGGAASVSSQFLCPADASELATELGGTDLSCTP